MLLPERSARARKLAQLRVAEATRAKGQKVRDDAYAAGVAEWEDLSREPTSRDFVALDVAEGYQAKPELRGYHEVRRSRHRGRYELAAQRLTERRLGFAVQFHEDQDLDELRGFWGATHSKSTAPRSRCSEKSNSIQLAYRTWRSEHGLLTIRVHDTVLRARLQAWIGRIRDEWTLESAVLHGV